jgi:hypothetical protein
MKRARVLTDPLCEPPDDEVVKLVDWIIVGTVVAGTVGVVAGRILVSVYEFRVQRRIVRILERNASLLEREGRTPPVKRS